MKQCKATICCILVSHQEFSLKFVLVTYPSFMETCKQLKACSSRFVVAQFLKEQSTDGQSSLFHTKIAKACCREWESWMTSVAIAMS